MLDRNLKRWELALMFGLLCGLLGGFWLDREQTQLADRVIRFHVIANSDSPEDKALKLQRLVLRAVRVGDHMKADHPVGQLGLLPVQPEAAQQSTQQPEHQSQLPALQIPIQHKNTVHPM